MFRNINRSWRRQGIDPLMSLFFALYRTESKNSGSFPKEGVLMLKDCRIYNYVCGYKEPK
jgi:hypothetical protein